MPPPNDVTSWDRASDAEDLSLRIGDIVLDAANYRVTRGVREVRIGPTEFRLLAFMMQNPDRMLTREHLRRAGWPDGGAINARTVDVYVGRLRRALNRGRDRDPIRTVRYAGYVFGLKPDARKGQA
jgi:two-component system, OmpR family, phosphate regulon response regulator PhoB